MADTWYERDGVWTQGPDGPAITRHALASDGRGTIFAFGGELPAEVYTVLNTNCRSCNVLGDSGWSGCPTFPGAPTTGRYLHAMTSAADGSIVMLGGLPTDNAAPYPYKWSNGAWMILGSNPTMPRYGSAMAFNPVTKNSYLVGGSGGTYETWRWTGAAWQTEYSGLPRYGLRVVLRATAQVVRRLGRHRAARIDLPAEVMTWDGVQIV